MDTAIKIKNVSVVLGGNFTALKNISVDLPAGRVIGFIGPSGAGKTTLIRSIVGRQKITTGNITVFGRPAGSPALREQLGYMTQETSVYADLTVRQNVRYFALMYGKNRREAGKLVSGILKEVDMASHADQLVSRLSGGPEAARVAGDSAYRYPRLMVLTSRRSGLTHCFATKYGACSGSWPTKARPSSLPATSWKRPSAAMICCSCATARFLRTIRRRHFVNAPGPKRSNKDS